MAAERANSWLRAALAALSCVLVTGCISDRDWHAPRPVAPDSLVAERTMATAQINEDAWPDDNWWHAYGDPQLDTLMSEALAGSPSLQVAQARLREAQAVATSASAPRLPNTTVNAETSRQRYSANSIYPPPFAGNYYTDGRVALDFSYDLDFWGHNREVLEAARANVRAAEADHAAARLALTVAVARAYFNLSLQFALLDIANASLEQQNAILDLTQQRASRGLENIARVKQSQGTVALTRVAVQYEEASIKVIRAQLGALVGAGPDRGVDLQRPGLNAPQKVELPSILPAELLGRRPDIVAQRWRVESATRGVAAAEAAFYPNVNLAAFVGFQAIGLGKLFNGGSAIVGAGPAVSLPVFNRRELHGALQSQQAQYDFAVAQYNQTLIDAVNEVANVVTNWDGLVKETNEARIAEDAAQSAYSITKERYRAGLDNYLTVLSSENEVFATQAIRAQLLTRELNLTADLVRALGGGYAADTPPGN
ncbi:MAG TPA: efflux transporter outer membrane subunit [Steroidobacteraceae bacterium]|nr:efflux transporter outer membrane subunit [Steroidobacteraceae bacterium]